MSKIVAIFLNLIILFLFIPQANQVSADIPDCGTMSLNPRLTYFLEGVSYDAIDNNNIPKGIQSLTFTFTDSKKVLDTNAYYRFRSDWDWTPTHQYSEWAQVNNNVLVLSTNDSDIIQGGGHKGSLEWGHYDDTKKEIVKNEPDSRYCQNIRYKVGQSYSFDNCQMTLSYDPPSINQTVIATISQAPAGIYTIEAKGNFVNIPNKIDIDTNGNGYFNFTTSGPYENAEISLFTDPDIYSGPFCKKKFNIQATAKPTTEPACTIFPAEPTFTTPISINATNLTPREEYIASVVDVKSNRVINFVTKYQAPQNGIIKFDDFPPKILPEGNYKAQVYRFGDRVPVCTTKDFQIKGAAVIDPAPASIPCTKERQKKGECTSGGGDPCDIGGKRGPGINTAIGCIHTNPAEFVKDLLTWVIGIGGGIAFLLMLLGAFQMLTSAGNPETLQAGRDRLTSAVIGLLFIVFSVLLLQIIGVGILNIPGFQ